MQWSLEVSWEDKALKGRPEGRVKRTARWPGRVRGGVRVGVSVSEF